MKQTITLEQLNELSDKGKATLMAWIWPPEAGVVYMLNNSTFENAKEYMLLSIGQMIEFLFDYDFSPTIISNDTAFYWIVEPQKHQLIWKKEQYENTELADALWEAVKEVLEKK